MQGKTHLVAGITTATLLSGGNPIAIGLSGLGSLLPDIDHSGSKLGRRVPWIGKVLKHRGITHSLISLVLVTTANKWLGLGYLTHLLLDMLTKQGVQLLYPLKGMYGLKLISTGGIIEKVTRAIFIGCFFYFIFKKGGVI